MKSNHHHSPRSHWTGPGSLRLGLGAFGIAVLALNGCAGNQQQEQSPFAHEPGKGKAIATAPESKRDSPGETDRPVTLSTGSRQGPNTSSSATGPTGGTTGNPDAAQPRPTGPRVGTGRSMDDAPAATTTTPAKTEPSATATQPAPAADDTDTIAKVRALALTSHAAKSYSTAVELAELVVAKKPADAEMYLLIARSVAGDYVNHAQNNAKQESMAKKAADAARNAWKHGKQDIAAYQGDEFAPLASAPAWIGVIGELKARAAKKPG